jgi:hypothetical protein
MLITDLFLLSYQYSHLNIMNTRAAYGQSFYGLILLYRPTYYSDKRVADDEQRRDNRRQR